MSNKFYFKSRDFLSYRILTLEKLGAIFNQEIRKLQLTPRRFIIHPEMNWLYLIESDHGSYTQISKRQEREQCAKVCLIRYRSVKKKTLFLIGNDRCSRRRR